MNFRVLTFFALMLLVPGISFAKKSHASTRLQAKPVVFLNFQKLRENLIEFIELWEKQNQLTACCPCPTSGTTPTNGNYIYDALLEKKIISTGAAIAKRLGACAVIEGCCCPYLNPAYDITQEAIDQLNKEYLATK